MPEIKHNFTGGRMNKDFDERIVKNGEYRDATNIQVSTSEDSEVGTVQNLLGNSLIDGQDFLSDRAICIGSISNEREDKVYYFVTNKEFVKNPNFSRDLNGNGLPDRWALESGWTWDSNNKVIKGNNPGQYFKVRQDTPFIGGVDWPVTIRVTLSGVESSIDNGKLDVRLVNSVGKGVRFEIEDVQNKTYEFTGKIGDYETTTQSVFDQVLIQRSDSTGDGYQGNIESISVSEGYDYIIEYDKTLNKITPVFVDHTKEVLRFNHNNLITGINIIDDMLFFTDGNSEPKKINIPRSIKGTNPSGNVKTNFINEFTETQVVCKEEHITVIKRKPVSEPIISLIQEVDPTKTNSAITRILDQPSNIIEDGIVGPDINFNNFEVGNEKTIELFTDLNGESGFTLDWAVGDLIGIKAFEGVDFDEQPSLPLLDYNIKGKIVASNENDFTDLALEVIPNNDFARSNTTGVKPKFWFNLPTGWNYNHQTATVEIDGSQYQAWQGPSLTNSLVANGEYILSVKINNYVQGGVNVWLCTTPAIVGDTTDYSNTTEPRYLFKLTDTTIVSNGVFEKEFNLSPGNETQLFTQTNHSKYYAGTDSRVYVATSSFSNPQLDIEYISLIRKDQTNAKCRIEVLSVPNPPPVVPTGKQTINFIVSKLAQAKKIFEFKFPRIAYRYKYQDNEYSAISPFSQVAFAPGSFNYHPKRGYNLGMANQLNSIEITNLKSLIPDGVKEIDIIYKEDTSPNLYVVDTIKPNTGSTQASDSWQQGVYTISSEQIYKAISSNQLLRPYDNVPKSALAQDVSGSRVIYGNYTQGFDLLRNNQNYYPDFNFNFKSTNVQTITLPSVKTLREYQIGAVFVDEHGRETPVISSSVGSKTLDKEFSDKRNQISVSFSNTNSPEGLKYVKFYIKETSGEYYNMAMDRFYDAGDNQLWLAFPSSDINKVDIDDFLILKKGSESNALVKNEAKYKILDIQREAPDHIKQNKILIEKITHNTDSTLGSVRDIFDDTDNLPLSGQQIFRMNYEEFTRSLSRDLHNIEEGLLYIQFTSPVDNNASKRYRINKIQSTFGQDGVTLPTAQYILILQDVLGDDVNWMTNDVTGNNSSSIIDNVTVNVYNYRVENSAKFDGKFFIKIDADGIANSNLLSGFLSGSRSYRQVLSKRLYMLDQEIETKSNKQLTGMRLGQYNRLFGRYAPFFRNYWSKPSRFTMEEVAGSTFNAGQYAFAEDQVDNNYNTFHQQTYIQSNIWRDELAFITVGLDVEAAEPNYSGNGFVGYIMGKLDQNIFQANARLADSHGWTKRNRENNSVWFIDKGYFSGKVRNNDSTLRYGSDFIIGYDYEGEQQGIKGSVSQNKSTFNISIGGILRNSEYTTQDGEETITKVKHLHNSETTQPNYFNVGRNGGNNNYNTNDTEDLIQSFVPGTYFRFREDPTNEIYKIVDPVAPDGYLRFEDGRTGGNHWDAQRTQDTADDVDYPSNWLWKDTIKPADNFNTPVQYNSDGLANLTAAWGFNFEPRDDQEDAYSGNYSNNTTFRPDTKKRTAQLSPNFSTNWKLRCVNSSNGGEVTWNPAGTIGPIPGGLKLTKAHSAYSSGSTAEPKANYSATGSECYIFVDSLEATNHDGTTKRITTGLILTTHSGSDNLDFSGTDNSKQPLLIWKIEEISGVFKLWLCGYKVPLCLSGTQGVAATLNFLATHDIVSNLPSSGGDLIFEQPTMNGYSQYLCNRVNAQDAMNHGYEVFDPDMGVENGVPGIMPVYYHFETLELIEREDVLPSNPAIWETEPKNNVDLDIYYEASGYNPLYINNDTKSLAVPIGSSIVHLNGNISIESNTLVSNVAEDAGGWYLTTDKSFFAGSGYIEIDDKVQINKQDGGSVVLIVENYGTLTNSKTDKLYFKSNLYGPDVSYVLNWHNCFSFGNGVESNRIRDNFNLPFIANGVKASTTVEFSNYEEETRKYGLIYSGLYNANSGINELNQFIAAESITKDLNPTYGSIQKLHARDSDLVALCEDKIVQILADKDALFEANNDVRLVSTNRVLGQSRPFVGEYGISKNPESFASESYRVYFSDKVRGAILRLSKDGLTAISEAGMKDWFKDNLKLSTKVIGSYDDKKDEYNVTIYKENDNPDSMGVNEVFVNTVSFKESAKGWVSFKSFDLENGASCANDYYTFKQGKIYQHHSEDVDRNTFYDNFKNSTISVLLNDMPSSVKSFHALGYEGSQARVNGFATHGPTGLTDYSLYNIVNKNGWFVSSIETEQAIGSLNEFIEKERKWFNYIKGVKNIEQGDLLLELTDFSTFNIQGVGVVASVEEDFIDFDVQLNTSIDVGDMLYFSEFNLGMVSTNDPNASQTQLIDNTSLKLAGIVSFANGDTIQVNNTQANIGGTIPSVGNYCFFVKNQIVNMANLLGYYANVKFENNSRNKVELFAVSAEVTESSK